MGTRASGSKPRRALLTRKALASTLACNQRTIAKWQDEGLPVAVLGRGGRPSLFEETAVRSWLAQRNAHHPTGEPVDLAKARTRKEEAQARLTEQLLATRAGRLLPADDVEREWRAEVAAVRTKILLTYTAQADRVYHAATREGLVGVEQALKEIAYDVLRELADPARLPAPTDGGQQQVA